MRWIIGTLPIALNQPEMADLGHISVIQINSKVYGSLSFISKRDSSRQEVFPALGISSHLVMSSLKQRATALEKKAVLSLDSGRSEGLGVIRGAGQGKSRNRPEASINK